MDVNLDLPLSEQQDLTLRQIQIEVERSDAPTLKAWILQLAQHLLRQKNASTALLKGTQQSTLEARINELLLSLDKGNERDQLVGAVLKAIKEDLDNPTGRFWWKVNLQEWQAIKRASQS